MHIIYYVQYFLLFLPVSTVNVTNTFTNAIVNALHFKNSSTVCVILECEAQNLDLRCQRTTVNLPSSEITSMISTASLSRLNFFCRKKLFFFCQSFEWRQNLLCIQMSSSIFRGFTSRILMWSLCEVEASLHTYYIQEQTFYLSYSLGDIG